MRIEDKNIFKSFLAETGVVLSGNVKVSDTQSLPFPNTALSRSFKAPARSQVASFGRVGRTSGTALVQTTQTHP